MSQDGRVIDIQQGKISHSEGQAYGMLLALAHEDKKEFKKLWTWTRNNLQMRKGDALFCWSWGMRPNGQWQVIDYNDAADGDILIAWALYLAWKKWKDPGLKAEAQRVVADIRRELVKNTVEGPLLMPGYYGFVEKEEVVLNPSYLIFNVFKDFAAIDKSSFWLRLESSSRAVIKRCLKGEWSLPPDWILVKGEGKEITSHPKGTLFGYEAWRMFLYASWAKDPFLKAGFERLYDFFLKNGYLPRVVDLKRGCVSTKDASAGSYASLGAYARWLGQEEKAKKLFEAAEKKIAFDRENYFSASLYLLAKAGGLP